MMNKLKNISLKAFRSYLIHGGLKHIRTKGGHEIWSAKGLYRLVSLQTHVDLIPEFIIKNNLRTMGKDVEGLITFLEHK